MSDELELYKKYRPSEFSQVVGQSDAIKSLIDLGKRKQIPHSILFTGASGCGKTTLARILKDKLKCSDHDFIEINAAEQRGIDMVRRIKSQMGLSPLDGPCKVYLIDESHAITSEAADSFLKILEDTPRHVYFFLCTTDPQKLKNTIITRCTEIRVKPLSATDLDELLKTVAEKEGKEFDQDVIDALVEASDGSARKALVMLHSVIGLADTEAQLGAIENTRVKSAAFDLARALLTAKSFGDVAPLLRTIEEDAEAVRRCILGYCRKVLISNKRDAVRAFQIIDAFRSNVFDSGHAGLAANCYEIFLD